jgi:hypothetical protein
VAQGALQLMITINDHHNSKLYPSSIQLYTGKHASKLKLSCSQLLPVQIPASASARYVKQAVDFDFSLSICVFCFGGVLHNPDPCAISLHT